MNRKPIEFRGSALSDLRAFPEAARRAAGFQLDRLQCGLEPGDWKPMTIVGAGVREIRIAESSGAFRVMYVAECASAIYVRRCFQKKTQRTRASDIDVATRRYRDLLREIRS